MSKLDQFESVFKSAAKQTYTFADVRIRKISLFTDLEVEASRLFLADVKEFLRVIREGDECEWDHFHGASYQDVGDLLDLVEEERPDLICAYRNIHGPARSFPFSLGAHVDVLTQATTTPVLLLPPPTEEGRLSLRCRDTNEVMVLTDHLTGSDDLISYAIRFIEKSGKLVLAHIEDDATFERYIDVIGKIPSIDTDDARERIRNQLLKEPRDYILSVISELESKVSGLTIEKEISMGHRVADCKTLVDQHDIDLVVLNTKDEDQLAMHGLAYPLAIELRHVPLLLL